ncbi:MULTISPECIES: DUF3833 family protein [unclassified Aureimonas]|uniref:DUF3833 family protein n=1 Tax=unclassified Aureimonas TaxID=2615206 RepID=UPI0006FAE81B|nr:MULTISPECIES: DUF3833 family protein [unclassified Aureimonas]KQT65995.1 hypothetical protein ASG62_21005 [Aureimonas sp. Leaf427]KQT73353.1 hypothetical protein ASG54_17485 [Aureimonas sp. Leaf460]
MRGLAALAALAMLAGCARLPAPDAAGAFRPELFFRGASVSRGDIRTAFVFAEPFTADFEGRETEGAFVLDEHFHFADGDRLQRWRLRPVEHGRYEGTVETEDGEGRLARPLPVEGYRTARGFVMTYDGFAPGGGATRLRFRHVMERQGDGSVSNLVAISKFGLPLASADVVFSKPAPGG